MPPKAKLQLSLAGMLKGNKEIVELPDPKAKPVGRPKSLCPKPQAKPVGRPKKAGVKLELEAEQEAGVKPELEVEQEAGVKPELEVKQEAGLEPEAAEMKQEAVLEAEAGAEQTTPAKKLKIEKLSSWERPKKEADESPQDYSKRCGKLSGELGKEFGKLGGRPSHPHTRGVDSGLAKSNRKPVGAPSL